jgi:predicted Rossmann fold nucleotide-binding protein DprA/Smf involved in DNA uptake
MKPTANRLEVLRREMIMRAEIEALLKTGPKTVPEVAQALGEPVAQVMLWMMAMRRYGRLAETGRPNDQGYFAYALKTEVKS